ncbi:hypothetical protein M378DRAFT_86934 [Amanita muscaria Koide BX008]|uniref:DUF427 domain-containing protein n=1 Tax=Amanita muscaria (strain Koide BX008) TaxID=946122 RepID=A0A0C2WA65_AMAMK|nr:hypothetical protein M378DRAFT_86934 [Amanita muscaria Koide BX008]
MPLSSGTSFFPLPHIEDTPRRVRAFFNGHCLVDTTSAKLVWQKKFYPNYFFNQTEWPEKKVRLTAVENSKEETVYQIEVGGKKAPGNLTLYRTGDLAGLFTIPFDGMDWFEEDDQIYVHPRDPYKRVDVRQSSRHVRVEINGVEVANTHAPRFLYETMLPVRTYIPKTHCHLELFEPSDLSLPCPYKGDANYYHVNLPSGNKVENVVWWYKAPNPGCDLIEGYVAFYDEKVDVWVDEKKQEHPVVSLS